MSYLLDTHILLWALSNDDKLPKAARAIIGDDGNEVCYSIISTWEVALKHSAHPDQLTLTAQQMSLYCRTAGFKRLDISEEDIFYLDSLQRPQNAPPHKDPFDRLLISQAKAEGLLFLTHDALLPYYNEPCILFV